jgi:hypothetical protein
MNQK